MRLLTLLAIFAATAARLSAQNCPTINFIHPSQAIINPPGSGSGLQRIADGSFTRHRFQTFSPYTKLDTIPNYQTNLYNCTGLTPKTPVMPPGWRAGALTLGVGAMNPVVADLLGNGIPVVLGVDLRGSQNMLAVGVANSSSNITFKSNTFYAVGVRPNGIVVADFNGDGKLDVAVVNAGAPVEGSTGSVSILLGNGDGTLQAAVNYNVGQQPSAATAMDFNGDGRPDLAITNGATNNVSVLINNGNGTFRAPVNYNTAQSPGAIAAADINGDGKPDLAIAARTGSGGGLSTLFGNGDGTFQTASNSTLDFSASFIATGDFNKDGNVDLALAEFNSGTVSILLGAGNGTFPTRNRFLAANPPEQLMVMDMDWDGNLDIVIAAGHPDGLITQAFDDTIAVLFGRGDGTLVAAPGASVVSFPQALAAGDLNGDGIADLVISGMNGSVSIMLGLSGGRYSPASTIPITVPGGFATQLKGVAIGDFNRDGKLDLAVADTRNAMIWILLGKGDGTFQTPAGRAVSTRTSGIAAGDLNGDGKLDLVVTNFDPYGQQPDTISILLGNGDGTFQTPTTVRVGLNPAYVSIADLNNDGKADLVVTYGNLGSADPGGISIVLGNGDGTFRNPVNYSAGISPGFTIVGDLNGDGKLDIVASTRDPKFANNFIFDLAIFMGAGDGTFAPASLVATDFGPEGIAIADFNGDGKVDLVVAHCCGETDITFHVGNGNGTFQPEAHIPAGSSPFLVLARDLNNDGQPDLILASNASPGLVSTLLNITASTSSLPPPSITGVLNGASFRLTISPGSWMTLVGSNFAAAEVTANTIPLPTTLGGVRVRVNGSYVPVYYVSPGQINVQLPYEVRVAQALAVVEVNGVDSAPATVQVVSAAPGIFMYGANRAVAQNVDAQGGVTLDTVDNPIQAGGVIIVYFTGQGPLDNPIPTGGIAPGSPLSRATAAASVTIGGKPAQASFLGMTPGYVALAQGNIVVPGDLPTGDYPVVITIDGVPSNGPVISVTGK